MAVQIYGQMVDANLGQNGWTLVSGSGRRTDRWWTVDGGHSTIGAARVLGVFIAETKKTGRPTACPITDDGHNALRDGVQLLQTVLRKLNEYSNKQMQYYAYMHTYVHTFIYDYLKLLHTYIYMHTQHMFILYAYIYVPTLIHTVCIIYTTICIHIYTRTCIHTCTCTYRCLLAYIQHIYKNYTYIHINLNLNK